MKKPRLKPSTQISARTQALALLQAVLGARQTLDEALSKTPLVGEPADQKFTLLLVLTVLRHLGQIDAVIAPHLDKPLPPKRHAVTQALRIGVAQLLLLHTPAHAAIHETVAAVKATKDAGLAGLVNAVLQKIAGAPPALPAPSVNLPSWVWTRWKAWYGSPAVMATVELAAQKPPLDLNTNELMPDATRLDAQMLRLPAEHAAVDQLPGYDTGAFFVQDIAASYPARLLGDVRERQVLDICAAPGGKSMQLMRAGGFVTALDRSASRMKRLKENFARMGMQANLVVADALEWEPNRAYDAILLDAPCSATGTWRRHPEVVQLATEAHITELSQLQRELMRRAWTWLKPGGRMVYCVCSLEREEGEAQAEWFLREQPDARVLPVAAVTEIPAICITPDGYLRTLPHHLGAQGGMDGFFAVCFEKN